MTNKKFRSLYYILPFEPPNELCELQKFLVSFLAVSTLNDELYFTYTTAHMNK